MEKHLRRLEEKLLQPDIRRSSQELSKLIDSQFFEYCSSGNIYKYKISDSYDQPDFNCEIIDFTIRNLGTEHIIYTVIKHHETNQDKKYSLRTSIWERKNNKWKIIFHQGTNIPKKNCEKI